MPMPMPHLQLVVYRDDPPQSYAFKSITANVEVQWADVATTAATTAATTIAMGMTSAQASVVYALVLGQFFLVACAFLQLRVAGSTGDAKGQFKHRYDQVAGMAVELEVLMASEGGGAVVACDSATLCENENELGFRELEEEL
jgi:hypothetical protein